MYILHEQSDRHLHVLPISPVLVCRKRIKQVGESPHSSFPCGFTPVRPWSASKVSGAHARSYGPAHPSSLGVRSLLGVWNGAVSRFRRGRSVSVQPHCLLPDMDSTCEVEVRHRSTRTWKNEKLVLRHRVKKSIQKPSSCPSLQRCVLCPRTDRSYHRVGRNRRAFKQVQLSR